MKITRKQYERALKIVDAYNKQEKCKFKHHFTKEDLEFDVFRTTISIPILNEAITDDDYAGKLQNELDEFFYVIDYVTISDNGYMDIRCRKEVTDEEIEYLLTILNKEFDN